MLAELIHEMSSPVSLMCVVRDTLKTGGASFDAGAERLRHLLDYASATLVEKPIDVQEVALGRLVARALDSLCRGAVCRGGLTSDLDEASAWMPADAHWCDVLLTAWIEAAAYGAPDAPLGIWVTTGPSTVTLTAASEADLVRDARTLSRRLAVRAGVHLAELCRGRLVVSATQMKSILSLPRPMTFDG